MAANDRRLTPGTTTAARVCSPLGMLLSAAAALPIVALPVTAGAQALADDIIPSVLPTGAAVGLRALSYRESGGRMKVREPVAWLSTPLGDSLEFSASGTVDTVSGASTALVSNASGRPVQILSGASITERRSASDYAIKGKFGDHTLAVSRTQSQEKDYISRAFGVHATLDFNERNTTLALGYGASSDRVMSSDDPGLQERRRNREYLAGITQILDRNSLVQSNLLRSQGRGYYDDPYRATFSFLRDGGFPPLARQVDRRPDSRDQWAWLTRYKRNLPGTNAVVSAEYRYFRDTWGVRAHTLTLNWLQTLNATWKIEPGLRYHSQGKADFYAAEITTRPTPRYLSSDQRLAAFGALEPMVRVLFQLAPGTTLDAGVSRYRQQASWKMGGGSPYFEPLSATLVNVGIVHRFQ